MIIASLRDAPPESRFNAISAPMRVKANDPSERVRAAAAETLTILRKRSREWFGRRSARQATPMEDHAGVSGTSTG